MCHWISMIQLLSSMDRAHLSQRSAGFIQIMTMTPELVGGKGKSELQSSIRNKEAIKVN